MTKKPRPLSPHLGIYKPQMSWVPSILHRMTGVALSLGLVVLIAWLVVLAGGPDIYAVFTSNLAAMLGVLGLYVISFALLGFCLCWLIGMFLKPSSVMLSRIKNLAIFIISLAATVGLFKLLENLFPEEKLTAIATIVGQVVLFGITWSFFFHFCNGIRHLFWDAGKFLSIRGMNITGWITVAISAVTTCGLWIKILGIVTW